MEASHELIGEQTVLVVLQCFHPVGSGWRFFS